MSMKREKKRRRHGHVVPRSITHAMEGTKTQEQDHLGTEVSIGSAHAQKLPPRVVKSLDAKAYP